MLKRLPNSFISLSSPECSITSSVYLEFLTVIFLPPRAFLTLVFYTAVRFCKRLHDGYVYARSSLQYTVV